MGDQKIGNFQFRQAGFWPRPWLLVKIWLHALQLSNKTNKLGL